MRAYARELGRVPAAQPKVAPRHLCDAKSLASAMGNRAFCGYLSRTADMKAIAGQEPDFDLEQAEIDGKLAVARNGKGATKVKPPKPPKPKPPPSAVTFAAVRAKSTPSQMTKDRIPPRKTTKVKVTVAGFAKGSDKIEISVDGGGGSAGDADIASGKKITGSSTVGVKGTTQTTPGSADGLELVAKQGGTEIGRSTPFSVSAIPQNYTDRFKSKVNDGTKVGMVVQDGWASDSGTFSDLDKTEISELVEETKATGPFVGVTPINSTYLPGDSLTTDSHTSSLTTFPAGAVSGVREVDQTCMFRDNRTGETDISMTRSGFKVVRTFTVNKKGKRTFKIQKFGAKATAKGVTSEAGRCNASTSMKIA
ncbi:MAG: hypothetical protein QOC68_1388 [Solirubrobacteraceae bacterium]|jgi:hypothetical protein|nr:hypothetical protein [Solirubrobacteraceae bacterium]